MEFIPALDLLGERSVRLRQGDFNQVTVYKDPRESVREYVADGASWIHIVDLDAARHQGMDNAGLIGELVGRGGARFEVGGGIRNIARAEALINLGVDRLVVGTRGIQDPGFLSALGRSFPGRIAAGLDYRRVGTRRVCALNGWLEASEVDLEDALGEAIAAGVAAVVVTDISKDGTLAGPDVQTYAELAGICGPGGVELVASGGVSSLADLSVLANIRNDGWGVFGAISGKAIQEGRLSVKDAVETCKRCA